MNIQYAGTALSHKMNSSRDDLWILKNNSYLCMQHHEERIGDPDRAGCSRLPSSHLIIRYPLCPIMQSWRMLLMEAPGLQIWLRGAIEDCGIAQSNYDSRRL